MGYHPKWEHIFKLNLRELHGHVRMVAIDPNVDPRKKRYIMQNLMASRWVLSQKHDTKILHTKALQPGPRNGRDEGEAEPGETVKNKPTAPSHFLSYTPDGRLGCKHYSRGCAFVYPCCNKAYTCRLCHDAASDHEADRKSVKEMICMHCGERQPPEKQCRACKRGLANYFCKICRFADDDKDNETYHCPYCNVCRRGKGLGIDFYHCMKCNQCISLERSVSHRCREGHAPTEGSCPICFDKLDSTRPLKELPCGHLLHSECFKCHIEHGLYKCPKRTAPAPRASSATIAGRKAWHPFTTSTTSASPVGPTTPKSRSDVGHPGPRAALGDLRTGQVGPGHPPRLHSAARAHSFPPPSERPCALGRSLSLSFF